MENHNYAASNRTDRPERERADKGNEEEKGKVLLKPGAAPLKAGAQQGSCECDENRTPGKQRGCGGARESPWKRTDKQACHCLCGLIFEGSEEKDNSFRGQVPAASRG